MKKILGLDLGTGSIGWTVLTEEGGNMKVDAIGSRIIPEDSAEITKFNQGQSITKNADRTKRRTQRKGYDRYQMRREALTNFLRKNNMLPDEVLIKLPTMELWKLRAESVSRKLTLKEIGRVLYHLNQKRGYKSTKGDLSGDDKSKSEYVKTVFNRYEVIQSLGKTIGEYFFDKLSEDRFFRCKDNVFPRSAYIDEFDKIISCQRQYYPSVLSLENIDCLRNKIIYYQRDLKSCKYLVSICDFEKKPYKNENGAIVYDGPKVAPNSSPISQVCKLWESINNIRITNRSNDILYISLEQKKEIFAFMDTHPLLKIRDLYSILGVRANDGWWFGKALGKGLSGNKTKSAILEILGDNYPNLSNIIRFSLNIQEKVDKETGEIIRIISPDCEKEPFYRLWHVLYSISDKKELISTLHKQIGIDEVTAEKLYNIDFVKDGYSSRSAKNMRRILPYLMEGECYSKACDKAGFNSSNSLSFEENHQRVLKNRIEQIKKGDLRQPIVEKILNQMINIVNLLALQYGNKDSKGQISKQGAFDEIHIELARELKQSRDERNETNRRNNENERENDRIAKLIKEYVVPTKSRIQKYKLWEETSKLCMYCNQPVDMHDFLQGYDVEVEHIIPKSLLFDDSFSNKTCSCRKCNQEKGSRTAYDYMKSKGDVAFNYYVDRVNNLASKSSTATGGEVKRGISQLKRERLLTPQDKIPKDFIDRQLRLSQFIAKRAKEVLEEMCFDVLVTTGSITDYIRHIWGWDTVLQSLNIPRYRLGGLTEMVKVAHRGEEYEEEKIKDWSKRKDNRHHAIDALVIACTKRGFIQRINSLNTQRDVPFEGSESQGDEYQKLSMSLENFFKSQPHLTTEQVETLIQQVLVSYRPGKRLFSLGKRYVYGNGKRQLAQERIIVPRGPLSEESVYGNIDNCWTGKNECVIKYPLGVGQGMLFNSKDNKEKIDKTLDHIIDPMIRHIIEEHIIKHEYKIGECFKEPLYYITKQKHFPSYKHRIRTVRCSTGNEAVAPIRYDNQGNPTGYVILGNNHHIAIYSDEIGGFHENVVTFWHGIERAKYHIPVIITNPKELWSGILEQSSFPESFLTLLPEDGWTYEFSMQQNEMFILGMSEDDYKMAIQGNDYQLLSKYLYKVQNIAKKTYRFCLHTQSQYDLRMSEKPDKRFYNISSIKKLMSLNPHKVHINILGEISEL